MTAANLITSIMQLPETERFDVAMAILDTASPSAMSTDEIEAEATLRQDEMESGAVAPISFETLVSGLSYRPRSLRA
jgi:hypothetical protein